MHKVIHILVIFTCIKNKVSANEKTKSSENEAFMKWADRILLKTFTSDKPIIDSPRKCDNIPSKLSCSWGECDSDYSGQGTVTMSSGDTWTGTWSRGMVSGWTNVTQEDGGVMTGYYLDNCLQDGLVTLELEFRTIVGVVRDGRLTGSVWAVYHNGEGG